MEQREHVLKHILEVMAGEVKGQRHFTDEEKDAVELLSCTDSPCPGLTSYSTLGTFRYDNKAQVGDKALRVEFVGICDSRNEWFPELLSTCAFAIIRGRVKTGLYEIYRSIISVYQPELEMKHLFLTTPLGFRQEFEPLEFDDKLVSWLMINPISEAERVFIQENGAQALLDEFVKADVDLYNLYRKSIF